MSAPNESVVSVQLSGLSVLSGSFVVGLSEDVIQQQQVFDRKYHKNRLHIVYTHDNLFSHSLRHVQNVSILYFKLYKCYSALK